MPKYRKKPIDVYVMGPLNDDNAPLVAEWCGGRLVRCLMETPLPLDLMPLGIVIETLEGEMMASPGDYIIREPFPTDDRLFYPCKPEIFAATYEVVDDAL